MSDLDFQYASKCLKRWRNIPEHAKVIDLFFERMKREATLRQIAADIRAEFGDVREAA